MPSLRNSRLILEETLINNDIQLFSKSLQRLFRQYLLHKKWRFPLRTFSVNVSKSEVFSELGHINWKNPSREIFCPVIFRDSNEYCALWHNIRNTKELLEKNSWQKRSRDGVDQSFPTVLNNSCNESRFCKYLSYMSWNKFRMDSITKIAHFYLELFPFNCESNSNNHLRWNTHTSKFLKLYRTIRMISNILKISHLPLLLQSCDWRMVVNKNPDRKKHKETKWKQTNKQTFKKIEIFIPWLHIYNTALLLNDGFSKTQE